MSLELGQNERPVLQNLSVELGVGEDEGAHRLEAILQAGRCLRGGDAVVRVRVPIRGGHQLRVGPARQEKHPFLRLDPIIQSVLIVVSICCLSGFEWRFCTKYQLELFIYYSLKAAAAAAAIKLRIKATKKTIFYV